MTFCLFTPEVDCLEYLTTMLIHISHKQGCCHREILQSSYSSTKVFFIRKFSINYLTCTISGYCNRRPVFTIPRFGTNEYGIRGIFENPQLTLHSSLRQLVTGTAAELNCTALNLQSRPVLPFQLAKVNKSRQPSSGLTPRIPRTVTPDCYRYFRL